MSDRFVRQADLVPHSRISQECATVIGIGAIGRQVALQLASIGVRRLVLLDFDEVAETNVTTQGYPLTDVGRPKVQATREAVLKIDPAIQVEVIQDRFRAKHFVSDVLFCCVDSIATREGIWKAAGSRARFFTDGRMLGEVIRVLTVADSRGREHYPSTLFPQSEAQSGSCTSRSTIFAASIAAGMMVHQFGRWLRSLPTDPDLSLNLLSSELSVA